MELWHESGDGQRRLLATEVHVADGLLAQARGRMFTRRFPEGSALVFPFDGVEMRSIHMIAVPYSLDVIWLIEEKVVAVKQLSPMVGFGRASADAVIELPAGVAEEVAPGDRVVTTES